MNLDTTILASPPAPVHIEEAPGAAGVEIQSRAAPGGIPLHTLLAAVQKKVPSVNGMHLRGDTLMVSHEAPPSDEDRDAMARVLHDVSLLNVSHAASASVPDTSGMLETLKNPATPDTEWLQTFRQYAVTFLLEDES